MQIKLNMAGVKSAENLWQKVPDDVYKFRVVEVEDNPPKDANSAPWSRVTLLICEGELAEIRQIQHSLSWGDSSRLFVKVFLEAFTNIEWDQDDMDINTEELVNLEGYGMTKTSAYPKKDGTTGTKSEIDHFIVNLDTPVPV